MDSPQRRSQSRLRFLRLTDSGIDSAIESIEDSMLGANDAMIDSMQRVIGLINVSTTWRTGQRRGVEPDSRSDSIAEAIESTIAWTGEATGSTPVSIGAEIASIGAWTAAAKIAIIATGRGDRPVAPTRLFARFQLRKYSLKPVTIRFANLSL